MNTLLKRFLILLVALFVIITGIPLFFYILSHGIYLISDIISFYFNSLLNWFDGLSSAFITGITVILAFISIVFFIGWCIDDYFGDAKN